MEKEVVINQSLNAKQLTNGSLHSLLYTRISIAFGLIYLVILANALLKAVDPFHTNDADNSFYFALLIATLVPLLFIFAIKRQAKEALNKKGRYYKNISFTITSEFIKSEGEGYSNTYRWEEIVKVKEIKEWYLVYINKQQALIINKSNLDSGQKESFNDLLLSISRKTKVSLK